MNKFIFWHIFKNFGRSFSLILSVFLSIITIFGAIYIFKNAKSAISYYSIQSTDENRLTLSASNSIINIFTQENSLNNDIIDDILSEENFENTQIFRLVTIPVSAKFGFFDFGLESDIPVFSVTDSALSGAKIPVWMSRMMLDLYNSQFAGSSAYFPQMREIFLMGQKIDFTFGKSKIFNSSNQVWEPITGTITKISNDFPGFGLILPESIVKNELEKIGFSLWNPYKIVTYVKNMDEKSAIEKKYSALGITTKFEIDELKKIREQINTIGIIIAIISTIIVVMIGIFFTFLLWWYFRERKNIFELISLFGLKSVKSYIITISEPIILSIFWLFFGFIFLGIFGKIFHPQIINFFNSKGILFPVIGLEFFEIFFISFFIFLSIWIFIIILDIFARKKYKFF